MSKGTRFLIPENSPICINIGVRLMMTISFEVKYVRTEQRIYTYINSRMPSPLAMTTTKLAVALKKPLISNEMDKYAKLRMSKMMGILA